jgi:hypothetical protein
MREASASATSTPLPAAACGDKSPLKWRGYCAPENQVASPLDGPTMGSLLALGAAIDKRQREAREAQAALFDFAEKRMVNKAGSATVAEAAAALRQALPGLTDAMGRVRQLRAHGEPATADVTALDQATTVARQRGDDAVNKARAVMADPTVIDAAAEARMQKLADALAAAKAKADELQVQRQASLAAAAEHAAKANETQRATLLAGLDATEKSRSNMATTLATFMARNDLLPLTRRMGEQITARLGGLEQKIAVERSTVDATSTAAPDAATTVLAQAAPKASGLAFEVRRTGADVTALTTSPLNVTKPAPEPPVAAAPPAPAPAPPPPPVAVPTPAPPAAVAPPAGPVATAALPTLAPAEHGGTPPVVIPGLVPTCTLSFEARSPGASIVIDHSPRIALPARLKIASGRHTLSVQRGTTKTEKHELLLCGHLDSFPVEGP